MKSTVDKVNNVKEISWSQWRISAPGIISWKYFTDLLETVEDQRRRRRW